MRDLDQNDITAVGVGVAVQSATEGHLLLNKAYDNRTWYLETEIITQASTEYCPETFS
jgi:hypothetical protein